MNTDSTAYQPTDAEKDAALKEFFGAIKADKAGRAPYIKEAPEAVRRLAKAVYGHDNSQALTVFACLASIYNGGHATGVRLDDIRHLDWSLLKDLLAVMVGTGHEGFEDFHIRKAFEEVGGADAVESLHWYTTGGPHRQALQKIIRFIKENRQSSTAKSLRDFLASAAGQGSADLGRLNYTDDDLSRAACLVLDGLYGRSQGSLTQEAVLEACKDAGVL